MIDPKRVFASIVECPILTSSQEDGGERKTLQWKIPSDLPYFNGHFPQTPVFPAVGIVDASIVLLRHVLNSPDLAFSSVETAKFLSPIGPGVKVSIEWSSTGDKSWQVDWRDSDSAQTLATLQLKA
jgi:3-hydroxymyristoyl/3-hydroxydecanoyl-(acyl carrier protein) dehydratase